jgi:TPR repeat protein
VVTRNFFANSYFKNLFVLLVVTISSKSFAIAPGEVVHGQIRVQYGGFVTLPEGRWEVVDMWQSERNPTEYVTLLRNNDKNGVIPLLEIRVSAERAKGSKSMCDKDPTLPWKFSQNSHGTKSSDILSLCSIIGDVGPTIPSWIQGSIKNSYFRVETAQRLKTHNFDNFGEIVSADTELISFNKNPIRIFAIIRVDQLGTTYHSLKRGQLIGIGDSALGGIKQWLDELVSINSQAFFNSEKNRLRSLSPSIDQIKEPEISAINLQTHPDFGVGGTSKKYESLTLAERIALATRLRLGMGVDIDHFRARKLLEDGDAAEHREGMLELAWLYFDGLGGERDEIKALELFQRAFALGNVEAAVGLGIVNRDGRIVPADHHNAKMYFRLAANAGVSSGQFNLALSLSGGQSTKADQDEAAYWYLKAYSQGYESARSEFERLTYLAQNNGRQRFESEGGKTVFAVTETRTQPSLAPSTKTSAVIPDREKEKTLSRESAQYNEAVDAAKPAESVIHFANRKALVIGNDSYKNVTRLLTAREDAKSMAEGLSRVGFQVTLRTDLTRQGMNAAIRNFKSQIEGGDEVVIFYAGHGVQLSNTNFLLPVDISGETEEQIKDDAVPLQRLLDDISEKRAKFTLAMLDACRDNPFKSSNGRSIGGSRGLSPTTAATGQMIVFSAGTGQQALDRLGPNDKDKNGVFTRVFLKQLDAQGVSVDKLVRNVRMEVVAIAKSVGHDQVPAIYDQVVGDFYFRK